MQIEQLENRRQTLQSKLDGQKTPAQRNVMGQFATPPGLAQEILTHAQRLLPPHPVIRFLDPAFGTGAFYSALRTVFPTRQIETATGYEIDPHYGQPSAQLWAQTPLNYHLGDFTQQSSPAESEKYNLLICNPPYVRHHHINGSKARLQTQALEAAQMKLSGLAGLYCYFIALSHAWLQQNGIAGWLIPSEFMDVNYGQAVKDYLLNRVTLLQIHRFDPQDGQFEDALVSSAIVWLKNQTPPAHHQVQFTYGGTLSQPTHSKVVNRSILQTEQKWTRFPLLSERQTPINAPKLRDFFTVKRGIATGNNQFFVLKREQIQARGLPLDQFRPILPSPRYLKVTDIQADADGFPALDQQLFVLDCKLPLDEIQRAYPQLYAYLEEGRQLGVAERYLCKKRKIWYAQENRPASRFYCTYIGRSDKAGQKPFRFILNRSQAIVANSYLILYPQPNLAQALAQHPQLSERVLEVLNQITDAALLGEGRVYGGGMYKMEPKELANVPAGELQNLVGESTAVRG